MKTDEQRLTDTQLLMLALARLLGCEETLVKDELLRRVWYPDPIEAKHDVKRHLRMTHDVLRNLKAGNPPTEKKLDMLIEEGVNFIL